MIYIITNPDFAENCVKIGYTTDLKARISTFNTGAPKDYEVFATYEVPKIKGHKPDKMLHTLLTKLDPTLKVNPSKEFFYLYPEEAYDILKYIAIMHNRTRYLHLFGTYKTRVALAKPKIKSAPSVSSSIPGGNLYEASKAKLISKGGSYILLKNSILKPWNGNPINSGFKAQQDSLLANGGAIIDNGKIITQVDLTFSSPSAAATLVYCCNKNGWRIWKTKDGKTIDEVERNKTARY